MPEPTEPRALIVPTTDGRPLSVAEWGDRDGYPVISLHGTPGCRLLSAHMVARGFETLIRSLGVRLIRYDRPGYGGSGRKPGRNVADAAADVRTIADSLGIEQFAVTGGSGGTGPALAVAAVLGDRVTRAAVTAPMAPYAELGHDEWTRGQDLAVQEYIGWVLGGEARMVPEFAREDAEMRAAASPDDPAQEEVFEQTRAGIWGWIDDEVSHVRPWGIDPASVEVELAIWHDPNDQILPRQHAEWIARRAPRAILVETNALGHESPGNPVPDWTVMYQWLIEERSTPLAARAN